MSLMSRDWSLLNRDWPDVDEMFRRLWDRDQGKAWLRVEEYTEGDTLVVRTEIPDIDPERDVDISVENGVLMIRAERQMKSENKAKDSYRSEFHYGSFVRTLPLPSGAKADQIQASYKDGVLEIRVPNPEPPVGESVKVPITRG